MDLISKIPKKFTKKFGNKVINRQYFRRKTGLQSANRPLALNNCGGLGSFTLLCLESIFLDFANLVEPAGSQSFDFCNHDDNFCSNNFLSK